MKNGGAKMIESWKVDSNKLMKKMNVTEKGLSDEQVLQIREKVGENLLEEAKKKSVLQVFLSQFCDLLVIILIISFNTEINGLLYLHFLKTLKVQL